MDLNREVVSEDSQDTEISVLTFDDPDEETDNDEESEGLDFGDSDDTIELGSSSNDSTSGSVCASDHDWRCKHPLLESKLLYCLTNTIATDIILKVGPEQTPLECHQIVLIASSPFFETLLSSRWNDMSISGDSKQEKTEANTAQSNSKQTISLQGDDPNMFQLLLECCYRPQNLVLAEKNRDVDHICSIICLARKYLFDEVASKCSSYIVDMLYHSVNKSWKAFFKAREINDPELEKAIDHFICRESRACSLHSCEEFLTLNHDDICHFVKDFHEVEEVDLFESICLWGEMECSRQELPVTAANIRLCLGKALYEIRFSAFDEEEFTDRVVTDRKGVLSNEEVINIYGYLASSRRRRLRNDQFLIRAGFNTDDREGRE